METLVQQFIKAFGWSILNSLWQSAIIYGVLFIVLFSLPKLAAKYKHNLAFGSIVLMSLCFVYNFIHQLQQGAGKVLATTNIQNIQAYQYFNNLPQSFSSKAEQYFPIVVAFYIIGIILQLFIIAKGYGQLSKFKKESLSAIPNSWKDIFDQVTNHLKINKSINFHLSSIVNVPLVIGYLKPVVLFPLALVNQLDEDQVEAILIHELSHIRRNDFLLNLIKTAIETLLFFNPFVWMAGRFIHIEREHACDDLVLKFTGKPLNYAHALLKLELLKDKNSPAYALAATGKTQNLYQRIKRITNMKTNYLNAKQQMAALTLGVACLFSIAWINPAEKKKATKQIVKENKIQSISIGDNKPTIYLDTTKKRKIKIVTIDANGNKTEYNSVKDMPDSLRKDFYNDQVFQGNRIYRLNSDTEFKFRDSLFQAKIYREFNSPEAQLKWKKFGDDVAKEYSSPEAQAKWKKFGNDIAKQYGSPEAQAKWKKMGEDMAKKMNSPEEQAKWKKMSEDMAKEFSSPEAQAKWKKMGEEMIASMNGPEFRAQSNDVTSIQRLSFKGYSDVIVKELALPKWQSKLEGLKTIKNQEEKSKDLRKLIDDLSKELKEKYGDPYSSGREPLRITFSRDDKVQQSEKYKKIKERFDKEVKELKEKMEKKEKSEKPERPERSEQ